MDLAQESSVEKCRIQDFCLFAFDDEAEFDHFKPTFDKPTFDVRDLDEHQFPGTRSIFFQSISRRS